MRIVTGGIAFYALFSIFPLIYLTLTLLTVFLPPELAVQLAAPISNFFSQNVEALSTVDIDVVRNMTPVGLSLRAFGALQLIITVISAEGGYEIGQFAGEVAAVADTLWISKAVTGFAIFYLILVLSLRGHLNRGTKAIAVGAAAGTVALVFVTHLFHLRLNYSVLGTLYWALASLSFGFVWLSASVMSLLLGAALAAEWPQAWGEDGADAAA